MDDNRDPRAEKEEKRATAALLLGAVADDYLEAKKAELRPRSLEMSTHYLKHHWKPLHRLPLKTVGRDVIASRLRAITRESGPSAANRARSTLSAMYAWAIGEGCATPIRFSEQTRRRRRRRANVFCRIANWRLAGTQRRIMIMAVSSGFSC